jgi:hypothetical protein
VVGNVPDKVDKNDGGIEYMNKKDLQDYEDTIPNYKTNDKG